jgi:ribonuclease BN (tRNA processing enzyme)
MNLTMLDVGFGDCFMLEDSSSRLIIDCGTLNPKEHTNKFDGLFHHMTSNVLPLNAAMVTHFHKDHCSGFVYMAKKNPRPIFDTIYLPNILTRDTLIVNAAIIGMAFESIPRELAAAKYQFKVLKALYGLARPNSEFFFINEGSKLSFSTKHFDVYSPIIDSHYYTDYKDKINEIHSALIDIPEYRQIMELAQRTRLWSWADEPSQSNVETYSVPNAHEIRSVNKELVNGDDLIGLQLHIERFAGFLTSQEYSTLNEHLRSLLQEIIGFRKDWNEASIVIKSDDNSLMMTGDMTRRIYDIIDCKYNLSCGTKIKVFKVPHHGTQGTNTKYYSNSFPCAEQYLISNGSRCSRPNWYITKNYPQRYAPNTKMVCSSNMFCDRSPNCICGSYATVSGAYHIII